MRMCTVVLAALCASATAVAEAPKNVSFQRDIVPLFAKHCAYCHMKEGPHSGLVLEPKFAYVMTVNVASVQSALKRVEPGHPERSYLLLKMQDRHRDAGGSGGKMPVFPGGYPRGVLTAAPADIALVQAWIEAGALND